MREVHSQYVEQEYIWTYIRDALSGESAIKRANTKYLPMPFAMAQAPIPSVNVNRSLEAYKAPYAHQNKAYEAYLQRARYPLIVAHTVRSLVGIAVRSPAKITLPPALAYLEPLLSVVFRKVLSAMLAYGRVWVAVDVTPDNKFSIVTYKALSGVDWEEDEYVVFKERPVRYASGGLVNEQNCTYVRLSLNEAGEYQVQRVDDEKTPWEDVPSTVPTLQGATLKRLPVVCCGSIDLDWTVDPIPVEGLAGCAMQLYMKDADLSQAEYMCCNPLLVFTGVSANETPSVVGSTVAIALPQDATAAYVEPSGSSLQHMLNTMDRIYSEASTYGAQLLGASKAQVESGEALRLRQNASGASLLSVMQLAKEAMERVLGIVQEWSGIAGEYGFEFSSDLSEVVLSPEELRSLTQTWMQGGISYETFFTRLQKGGVIPEDRTPEEERQLIETEAPALGRGDIGVGAEGDDTGATE